MNHSPNKIALRNMRVLTCLGLLCLPISLLAQFFPVSSIPAELKKDARAVIRLSKQIIHVKDEKRASLQVEQVVTLFNRGAAEDLANIVIHYDKFDKIGLIEGEVFDANGKRIRKLKEKEIRDVSASGGSFASDNRVKIATLSHDTYPYTVYYRYQINIKGMFGFPLWMPQDEEGLAIENAELEIVASPGQEIRHKSLNIPDGPEVTEENGTTRYRWEVKDLPAIEEEPNGPSWREYTPTVYLAPVNFEIQGYQGSTRSWQEFGAFFYALNAEKGELPKELVEKVRELTADLETDEEKIAVLYRYMQENTRYVSIQLGIGGWQTFDPEYVYENGYGDCKALSNYVKSMLAEVGITAFPAIIRAGDYASDVLSDFSGNQFNHVILCVPNGGDTLWLECTVNNYPAGYLGQFTADRYALLTTPEGGKLIRTPASPPEANLQIRKAEVTLDKQGNASAKVRVTATGYQQDNLLEMVDRYSERDREKWLRKSIDAKSFELTHYQFDGVIEAEMPTYRYQYKLTATNWASASGSRFFLAPNQLQRYSNVPEKMEGRTQPVLTKYPYLDTDTITYTLPEGFVIEAMPEMPLKIESEFGTYTADIDFQPETGTMTYIRSLRMRKTRQPASAYDNYRQFMRDIVKADKVQIVLSGKS